MRPITPPSASSLQYALPHPLVILLLVIAMFGVSIATAMAAEADTPPQRARQLAYLVRQDCGSCHGMTLAGGLGPPLLPAALAGKPAGYLKHVILNGSNGTAMPGWAALLSEADAVWIAENLLRGVPDAR
jgi:cytochrome c55X